MVLVYDSSLDNHHQSTKKFARRWFAPYVVTSTNDNATYHLATLNETRLVMRIVGEKIKIFKKQ